MTTTAAAPRHESTTDAPRGEAPRRGDIHKAGIAPWLFLAPYLVLFVAFVLGPIVYGLYISLHRYDFTLPNKPFVGIENYVDLFTPGSLTFGPFWQSMRATAIFTIGSVPLLLIIPLAIALVMNRNFPGRNVFRALYFAPYVLGVAVVAIVWRYLLDANIGPVNWLLGLVGLPDNIAWTTSTPAAWFALIGVTVWWTLGFNAVIYLAGLQDIPKELYEAAEMDGASRWQQFRHVTLPGLKPVLSFVTMITIIASANMFGQAYLITRGAPGTETRTAIYQIAETGLRNYQMGSAAAMSYVLTVFLILLSLLVFWLFRDKREKSKKDADAPLQAAPMMLRQGRG
jgi:multiple sugar transport system permease protein